MRPDTLFETNHCMHFGLPCHLHGCKQNSSGFLDMQSTMCLTGVDLQLQCQLQHAMSGGKLLPCNFLWQQLGRQLLSQVKA
jgi:hypothetical protein